MVGPDPQREIYPNAPLKLVAFEYRFEPVPLPPSTVDAFRALLGDAFPIQGTPPHQQLVVTPTGASATNEGLRCFDSGRRRSIVLIPEALIVETSAYSRFEDFRDVVGSALDALDQLDLALAPVRLGMRYIDEIDEQPLPQPVDWSDYIQPQLSGALGAFENAPAEFQAAALFESSNDKRVVLRYGLMRQPAVDPAGPLLITDPPRGRYFLVDIDSSWAREPETDVRHERGWLGDMLGMLHAPIRHLFESTITDRLRDELLRKETL